jgi:hypothetical protein
VTIAALALKQSLSPKQIEIRYVVKRAVNPPLPPLPVSKPELPAFLEVKHYVN